MSDNNFQETNKSGLSNRFLIRCHKCRWGRASTGHSLDLEDLVEINPGCTNCGKWRKFKCPKCGQPAMMKRIKGNDQ